MTNNEKGRNSDNLVRPFIFTIDINEDSPMIITISEVVRIVSDRHYWKLNRKRAIDGITVFEPYRYFTSLHLALEAACQFEILSEAISLTEAAYAISRLARHYERTFDDALSQATQL